MIDKFKYRFVGAILLLTASIQAQDVENDFETRYGAEVSFKPIKKLTLSVAPEMRLDKAFAVNKFLIEGDVKYKIIKQVSIGAGYRFMEDRKKDDSFEIAHRYSLFSEYSRDLGRIKSSIGVNYSNYSDDSESGNIFRYKAALKYNIKGIPLSPIAKVEGFHDIDANTLYKMRYSAGCEWKLFKHNYVQLDYKFDYYRKEYKNKHIVSLGYKYNF